LKNASCEFNSVGDGMPSPTLTLPQPEAAFVAQETQL
jgi:hypothetical protein